MIVLKKGLCSILLLSLAASIAWAQDSFKLSGAFSDVKDSHIVILNYVDSEGKNVKDTSMIEQGKFAFDGTTAFANKAYLSLTPLEKDSAQNRVQPDYQEFYLEKGNFQVTGTDSIQTATIIGGHAQRDYLVFNTMMGDMPEKWKQIVQDYQKLAKDKDEDALKALQEDAKVLRARMESTLDSFIFLHPNSYVSADLIHDNRTSVIEPEEFAPYYDVLSADVLASFTGRKITAKYEKAKQISIGKSFDFRQEDAEGNPFQLSSLRGKYVLVDFWASWCVPCRQENPHLLKAHAALKDKGFDIVGVSLDDNKTAWLKAVEMDELPWTQVSDLKGWKNEVALQCGITAIPQNVLLDPQGVIIAKNLRGEDVAEQLAAFIK